MIFYIFLKTEDGCREKKKRIQVVRLQTAGKRIKILLKPED